MSSKMNEAFRPLGIFDLLNFMRLTEDELLGFSDFMLACGGHDRQTYLDVRQRLLGTLRAYEDEQRESRRFERRMIDEGNRYATSQSQRDRISARDTIHDLLNAIRTGKRWAAQAFAGDPTLSEKRNARYERLVQQEEDAAKRHDELLVTRTEQNRKFDVLGQEINALRVQLDRALDQRNKLIPKIKKTNNEVARLEREHLARDPKRVHAQKMMVLAKAATIETAN